MKQLLIIGITAAGLLLTGCSEGEGPAPGFNAAPPLVSFTVQQCRSKPENRAAVQIGGATFGPDANTETGRPENTTFFANCVQ